MSIISLQVNGKRVLKTTAVCFLASFIVCILDCFMLAPIVFAFSIPLSNYDLVKNKTILGLIAVLVSGVFFAGFFLGFFLRSRLNMGADAEILSGVICGVLLWLIFNGFLTFKNKVLSIFFTLILAAIACFIVKPLQQHIPFFQKLNDPGTIFLVWQTFMSFAISLGFGK